MTYIIREELDLPIGDLSHYGVKGMHWGVRRSEPGGGGRTRTAAEKAARRKEIGHAVVTAMLVSAAGLTLGAALGNPVFTAAAVAAVKTTVIDPALSALK